MPLPNPLRINHRCFVMSVASVVGAQSVAFACPSRGRIVQATLTAHAATTGATSLLTMTIGGVAVTVPTANLTAGAAGATGTVEPTGANVVNQGEVIALNSAAGVTGTSAGTWVVVVREF
jgi:hypothetical protein